MGYYVTQDGAYYEGDRCAIQDTLVSRRPAPYYTWSGAGWQLNMAALPSSGVSAIDAHILEVLNTRGYDGPHSIAKYQNLTDAQIAGLPDDERPFATQWRSECQAAALWIVRAYTAGLKVLADVQAGARQAPSDAELIAELPAMVWPEG